MVYALKVREEPLSTRQPIKIHSEGVVDEAAAPDVLEGPSEAVDELDVLVVLHVLRVLQDETRVEAFSELDIFELTVELSLEV